MAAGHVVSTIPRRSALPRAPQRKPQRSAPPVPSSGLHWVVVLTWGPCAPRPAGPSLAGLTARGGPPLWPVRPRPIATALIRARNRLATAPRFPTAPPPVPGSGFERRLAPASLARSGDQQAITLGLPRGPSSPRPRVASGLPACPAPALARSSHAPTPPPPLGNGPGDAVARCAHQPGGTITIQPPPWTALADPELERTCDDEERACPSPT